MKCVFAIMASIIFIFSKASAQHPDQVLWTQSDLKDFKNIMKDVSNDVQQFINANPDWVADNLGGLAYNLKQASKDVIFNFFQSTQNAIGFYLDKLGIEHTLPPMKDGIEKLCESPRICQGLQYITAQSIVDRGLASGSIDFYLAYDGDGTHSFVVAFPRGVPATPENLKIQGIVIDAFPTQDSNNMVYPGGHPRYSDVSIDTVKLSHGRFIEWFGRDPFNSQPIPPTDPNPPTDPPTPPTPPPTCPSDNDLYDKDANGNVVYFNLPDGSFGPRLAYAGKGTALVRSFNGVTTGASGYTFTSACNFDLNRDSQVSSVLNVLPLYVQTGLNCAAVYTVPAGTVMTNNTSIVPFITELFCP